MQAVPGCARGTADDHAVDLEAQEGGEQVAGGSLLCVPGSRGLGSAPLSVNSLFPWASWGFRSLPHSSWPLQKKRQLGGVGALRHGCRVDHVHAARGGRRARWGQKFSLLGASGRTRPVARSRVLPRGFRAVVLSPTGAPGWRGWASVQRLVWLRLRSRRGERELRAGGLLDVPSLSFLLFAHAHTFSLSKITSCF